MTHEILQPNGDTELLVLDRVQLAISLRKQGLDVDFEDWDGLSDESVSRIASVLVGLEYSNRGDIDEV